MRSILDKFNFPDEINKGVLKSVDANISFFNYEVSVTTMYLILAGVLVVLIGINECFKKKDN